MTADPKAPPKLVVHGVDPKRWAERYGFEPFSTPCGDCGRTLTTTLPLVWGALRGMIAEPCACGNPNPPYGVILPERWEGGLHG